MQIAAASGFHHVVFAVIAVSPSDFFQGSSGGSADFGTHDVPGTCVQLLLHPVGSQIVDASLHQKTLVAVVTEGSRSESAGSVCAFKERMQEMFICVIIAVQLSGSDFHLIENIVLYAHICLAHQVAALFIIRDHDTKYLLKYGSNSCVMTAGIMISVMEGDQLFPGSFYGRMIRKAFRSYFFGKTIVDFLTHNYLSFSVL